MLCALEACTPAAPPCVSQDQFQALQEQKYFETRMDVLAALREKTHLFCADAAEEEVLCGKLLVGARGASEGVSEPAVLPAVKIRIKEKCHAARRICSRSFPCDPYLSNVANCVCLSHDAISKKIKYSDVFKARFSACVKKQRGSLNGKRVKAMGSAPHRFDSHSRPFGRAVLWYPALIFVASSILRERGRTSEAGNSALKFLQLAQDEESYVQLAMFADAADENTLMVRYFDQGESFDKSSVAQVLDTFLNQIRFLFVQRGALRVHCYTKYALEFLESTSMLVITESDASTSGGKYVCNDVLDRCFGRMVAWCVLAQQIILAEYPGFEILQCFSIFNVFSDQIASADLPEDKLKRFCQVVIGGYSPWARLMHEVMFVRPLAHKLFSAVATSSSTATLDAWIWAMRLVEAAAKDKACRTILARVGYSSWRLAGLRALEEVHRGHGRLGVEHQQCRAHVCFAACYWPSV